MSGDRLEIGPDSLPVEELPDVSWQRVERKLFAQLATGEPTASAPVERTGRRRRAWLIAGGSAVAAAAAVLVILALRGGSGDGEGEAQRVEPATGRTPSRIATQEAPSAVSVGDVSLEIAPHSAILVDEDRDRGALFVLERGEATFRVAPVGDGPPVVVQAGDLRIEVIGTAFAVSREGDSARVLVYEGVVSLLHRGERTRLAAGSVWPSAPAPEDEPADPAGHHPRRPAVKTPPSDRTDRQPKLDAPPAGERERYRSAQALEGSDPDKARAIYGELAAGRGTWAPMALYAQALLEDRLGRPASARRLLQQYLRRYPNGMNAGDARQLLDEIGSK